MESNNFLFLKHRNNISYKKYSLNVTSYLTEETLNDIQFHNKLKSFMMFGEIDFISYNKI